MKDRRPQSTHFIPLGDALCSSLAELHRISKPATLSVLLGTLTRMYCDISIPPQEVIYNVLGALIAEGRIFCVGDVYCLTSTAFSYHHSSANNRVVIATPSRPFIPAPPPFSNGPTMFWNQENQLFLTKNNEKPFEMCSRECQTGASVVDGPSSFSASSTGFTTKCDRAADAKLESRRSTCKAVVVDKHNNKRHSSYFGSQRRHSTKDKQDSARPGFFVRFFRRRLKSKSKDRKGAVDCAGSHKDLNHAGVPTPATQHATFSAQFPPTEWLHDPRYTQQTNPSALPNKDDNNRRSFGSPGFSAHYLHFLRPKRQQRVNKLILDNQHQIAQFKNNFENGDSHCKRYSHVRYSSTVPENLHFEAASRDTANYCVRNTPLQQPIIAHQSPIRSRRSSRRQRHRHSVVPHTRQSASKYLSSSSECLRFNDDRLLLSHEKQRVAVTGFYVKSHWQKARNNCNRKNKWVLPETGLEDDLVEMHADDETRVLHHANRQSVRRYNGQFGALYETEESEYRFRRNGVSDNNSTPSPPANRQKVLHVSPADSKDSPPSGNIYEIPNGEETASTTAVKRCLSPIATQMDSALSASPPITEQDSVCSSSASDKNNKYSSWSGSEVALAEKAKTALDHTYVNMTAAQQADRISDAVAANHTYENIRGSSEFGHDSTCFENITDLPPPSQSMLASSDDVAKQCGVVCSSLDKLLITAN